MAATTTIRHRQTKRQNHPKIQNGPSSAINHAVRLIHAVCGLAGSATLIDDIRADLRADKVQAAIRNRNTAVVFDWLMAALSYQGISDQAAYEYMARHGRAEWRDIEQKLGQGVSCPKLKSYWHFHGCRYHKASRTCAEPDHIGGCPLPSHDLRNGHLNQAAYSLFLFIRDLADGDLIGWIDAQLKAANSPPGPDRLARMAAAIIEPLREIYGVSDKVLTMALSALLLGAPKKMGLWTEVGGSMIAISTIFCTGPAFSPGSTQTTCMVRPATGPAAAPTLFKPWPSGSMPGSSIRRFHRPFPGSSSTRSGSIAARAASMSATAIALMMGSAAAIWTAGSASCVIGSRCAGLSAADDRGVGRIYITRRWESDRQQVSAAPPHVLAAVSWPGLESRLLVGRGRT
jgi:hypothetical protein